MDRTGAPVGIVSMNDVARALGNARSGIPAQQIAETLRGICEPRERILHAVADTG